MSQIPTSAPRTPSLLDGLSKEALPSESKSAKPDKAKGSFADHLTAPDAQATLTQAKRLTQGASRSSPSLTKDLR